MRISIVNLHDMCENNTFFLSKVRRYFQLNGHTVTNAGSDVDLVFIGGCAVTDVMRGRCEKTILKIMQQPGQARFVVFGCLAAFPEGLRVLLGRESERFHIIPYESSHKLDELTQARIPYDTVSVSQLKGHVPYQPRMGPGDSYVMIAQGCVNKCSYCNIKKVKGNVASRQEEAIEGEVLALYDAGIGTVTLLADDCGSYGFDLGSDLPKLLLRLRRAAPDMRYKLYTVFPSLFLRYAEQLEPLFAEHRVPYVCLPVQSAALRVLGLMNRRYDPDDLAGAIKRLRALDPEVFVYSHFIFNFPTETWEEFEESIAFSRHFDHCVFIGYGENSGTEAAGFFPKCDSQTLQAKVQRLEELVKRGELAAFVVPSP
jgi:threonylcarbamoyladenosine tRNA methylthiotransferase CDKAL1